MSEESLSDRLTEEITSLSTKLVTAVSKQLELEEKLLYYHRENHQLKTKVNELTEIDNKYTDIEQKYKDLSTNFTKVSKERDEFDNQNKKLQTEVEELTASLFDEANKMVDNASRETYNFKIKNRKLYEEIDEKNLIIENLQNELGELKKMFEDEEKKNKTKRGSLNHTNSSKDFTNNALVANKGVQEEEEEVENFFDSSIFSPKLKAIRFDLANYQEFKEFAGQLIKPTYTFDLNSLKLSKWFKKVWIEEIENSFTIPSTNLFNRWQKGKFFWNAVIDGKIKIEPIKNINDNISTDMKTQGFDSPCDFCQESRSDKLEHLRLHSLKLTHLELNEPVDYPLCNYCLIKIRNVCDFFAKLRLVNKNFYKLDSPDNTTEYKLIKIYINLCLIRCKNFWGKIGYYDNVNEISQINIDEIDTNDFKLLLTDDSCSIHSTEAIKSVTEENKPSEDKEEESKDSDDSERFEDTIDKDADLIPQKLDNTQIDPKTEAKVDAEADLEAQAEEDIVQSYEEDLQPDNEIEKSSPENESGLPKTEEADVEQEVTLPKKKNKSKKKKKTKVSEVVGAFEEASLKAEEPSKPIETDEVPETIDLTMDESGDEFADSVDLEQSGLSRKKSKSKQFSKKINSGLDDTLKMLEESIHESK